MSYLPAHLNQFHDPNGKPWRKTDGTDFNGENCWATAGAMAADFATRGKLKLTPPQIRKESGDREGGANREDVARVLKAHGIQMLVRNMPFARLQARLATGRWGAIVAIDYDGIPTDKQCTRNFHGYHMIFLPPGVPDAQGRIEYDDPLCENRKKGDAADLKRAAAMCARQEGVTRGVFVGLVKQPKGADDPKPDPKPDPCEALQDQLDDALDRLAQIEALASGENE